MNLRTLDLNLLVIFEAMMNARSLTDAADVVGVSQSAMSHALRRLRETFKDDLFKRTSAGIKPTPRAVQLAKHFRRALKEIRDGISEQFAFDPRTSERTFDIRMSDYLVACLLPRLCARLRADAPHLKLSIRHPLSSDSHDLDEVADLQLAVCSGPRPFPGYKVERLFQSPYVIAMRNSHVAARKKMTREVFQQLPFLDVTHAATGTRWLDDQLALQGLSRKIFVTLPSLSGVLSVIGHSDLCVILPKAWLEMHDASGHIASRPLPSAQVLFTVDQILSADNEQDPAHRWLRSVVAEEFGLLHSLSGGLL